MNCFPLRGEHEFMSSRDVEIFSGDAYESVWIRKLCNYGNKCFFIAFASVKHHLMCRSWDSVEANEVPFQWGRTKTHVPLSMGRPVLRTTVFLRVFTAYMLRGWRGAWRRCGVRGGGISFLFVSVLQGRGRWGISAKLLRVHIARLHRRRGFCSYTV